MVQIRRVPNANLTAASIVPYRGFKTKDGDILIGGGNDRLFGILCSRLEKSEWPSDSRFSSNASRVANRGELESLIEAETTKKTTHEWLDIFKGSGMPYAPINDVQDTLNHEQCELALLSSSVLIPPFDLQAAHFSSQHKLDTWLQKWNILLVDL